MTIFTKANLNFKIVGICPGDKVPTSENPLLCRCPAGSIQLLDDRCAMCTIGEEVPNEDQTACVGMFEKWTQICLMALLLYLSCTSNIVLTRLKGFSP